MDKKDILSKASTTVASRRPNWFVRAWRWIKRQTKALWQWLRGLDKLVFFNIALLLLVIVMLLTMLCSIKKVDSQTKPNYVAPQVAQMERPTVIVARNGVPVAAIHVKQPAPKIAKTKQAKQDVIVLPLRREQPVKQQVRRAAPAPVVQTVVRDVPVARQVSRQSPVVIDGRAPRNVRLQSMAEVNGDLYLQNMRTYTLPCGTRINGNLYLRNVGLLKFCGCFDVAGNIYVSSNSSFGPIPKDAYLGGQVIF